MQIIVCFVLSIRINELRPLLFPQAAKNEANTLGTKGASITTKSKQASTQANAQAIRNDIKGTNGTDKALENLAKKVFPDSSSELSSEEQPTDGSGTVGGGATGKNVSCNKNKPILFVSRTGKMPNITINIQLAIKMGKPKILHRETDKKNIKKNRKGRKGDEEEKGTRKKRGRGRKGGRKGGRKEEEKRKKRGRKEEEEKRRKKRGGRKEEEEKRRKKRGGRKEEEEKGRKGDAAHCFEEEKGTQLIVLVGDIV